MSMSRPAGHVTYTFADYLAVEEVSTVKHEFLGGQILAMAGGTPEHAALAASVIGLLFGQLREGKCRVYDSDLRVRVQASGLATYPDVTVVCGPLEHDPEDRNTIVNPTVIVEVLSRRTEEYDRGEKFAHYKQVPSLREYVLVAFDEHAVEVWARSPGAEWTRTVARTGATVRLASIACTLDVDALYDSAVARS
jgi:Uma2 family endonuclease